MNCRVLHSHDYRTPEEFAGKTVALLGAGFSGLDISLELAVKGGAKKVYLVNNYSIF